jgi:hypothetical protein
VSVQLFEQQLSVVNVGLASFAEAIRDAKAPVVHLEWSPPAQGDRTVGMQLAELLVDKRVDAANQEAVSRLYAGQPILRGVAPAREVIPGIEDRMLLHAGPPIAWDAMSGPMQGAIIGAILFEGWAATPDEARRLAAGGAIRLEPNHHHAAVGPMAGVTSPSMPVWIVENQTFGNMAFSSMNEGLGKVLRFGAYDDEVLGRLRWMRDVLGPAMARALDTGGPIEIAPLIAQALHMGDEVHNRNVAASGLLFRRIAPALVRTGMDASDVAAVLEFISGNDHFFLNVSMASCKAMLDAAHGVPASSLVTAMARNGVDFGIRVSGLGDEWLTAPAPMIDGLYFPGYSAADANPDLGDSAIAETVGLGGFSMAAAPAIVQFVGGSPQDAVAYSREMLQITLGTSPAFTLPALSFTGAPSGIDARLVVDTGVAPIINTGIAHRQAGIGQVGAGLVRAPMACFERAIARLAETLAE